MTREEAIEWMQEEKASFERAPDLNGCPMTEYWQKAIDVYDMAISALRRQEHFREVTKKVEPLTLDELRKMDGEPVYCVEITGRKEWLFRRDGGFADMYGEFTSDDFMVWDNYGKLWWCYRQKPEENDYEH